MMLLAYYRTIWGLLCVPVDITGVNVARLLRMLSQSRFIDTLVVMEEPQAPTIETLEVAEDVNLDDRVWN